MEYTGAQAEKNTNTFRIQTRGNKVNLNRYFKKIERYIYKCFWDFVL